VELSRKAFTFVNEQIPEVTHRSLKSLFYGSNDVYSKAVRHLAPPPPTGRSAREPQIKSPREQKCRHLTASTRLSTLQILHREQTGTIRIFYFFK